MPLLSPAKLLVILVVALVVLGPDKLPKVAKQMGSLWADFRRFRERFESDVRGNFPDLPSAEKISQAVRSPITFLDSLADAHTEENGATASPGDPPPEPDGDTLEASGRSNRPAGIVRAAERSSVPGTTMSDPQGVVHQVRVVGRQPPDDPGMN